MNIMYEIMALQNEFRGMERAICLDDLPLNKRNSKELLQIYLDYEECLAPIYGTSHTIEDLRKLEIFCAKLHQYNVLCELVAYDNEPITNIDGYEIEFLGIDFEIDGVEGILQAEYDRVRHLLNCNCLCENVENVKQVVNYLNIKYKDVELFYMYKVVLKQNY